MIHLRRDPGPGPRLAFVNALGTELEIWDGVVDRLHGSADILRHDLGGHRRSPGSARTLGDHADALAQHLPGPTILCGLSIGGQIAMQTALAHPGKVAALVLCATDARIGTAAYYEARIARVQAQGMGPFAADQVLRWFSPDFARHHPDIVARAQATLAAQPVDGYVQACRTLARTDLTPRLRDIAAPTLCLTGSADVSIPPERIARLAARIPRAVALDLPGLGHLPCLEDPDAMAGILARVIAGLRHGQTFLDAFSSQRPDSSDQ